METLYFNLIVTIGLMGEQEEKKRETIYSSLGKNHFKDHYGDAATEQCLGMIAVINAFSVSDEMLQVIGQTGRWTINVNAIRVCLTLISHGMIAPYVVE